VDATRRSFISASGQVLGAGWLALNWPRIAAAAEHAHAAAKMPAPRALTILGAAEARDVEAIAAQIIPTDDTPGAREAGAVFFIDAALGGFFKAHRAEFRSGLDEFAAAVAREHPGRRFADLEHPQQIGFLKSAEKTPFFQGVRFLTILGLLASPSYGGNRDGIGWKLIGFEDVHVFSPPFGYYDRDYPGFAPYTGKAGA
jgi:gluconate 2-dehydrogenase gamma chain